MSTGENIKRLRKEKRLTQKKLGELCVPPISESTIRKYELGLLNPKLETAEKIAKALGVSIYKVVENFNHREYKKTEEFKELERSAATFDATLTILRHLYRYAEEKSVNDTWGTTCYYLIGSGDSQFILLDSQIEKIINCMEAVVPFLVNEMKDTRAEAEVVKEMKDHLNSPEYLKKLKQILERDSGNEVYLSELENHPAFKENNF